MTQEITEPVLTNRQKRLSPKAGLYWCYKCDRDLVSDGEKCLTCGRKNGKKRFKYNSRNV